MERSRSGNRWAIVRAIERRDGVTREIPGMGPHAVGDVKGDRQREPQVVIWRVGGDRNRPRAGWTDAETIAARRRQAVPWLLWLCSIVKCNRFLSLRFWSRTQARRSAPIAGRDGEADLRRGLHGKP
jgi:hypothetical protein